VPKRSLRGIAVGREKLDVYGATTVDGQRRSLTSFINHVQKTRHRSVRLSARHLRTHQHPSRQPARKSCFPTKWACCAAGSPPTTERSCRGCSGARNDFFLSAVSWWTRRGADVGGQKSNRARVSIKVTLRANSSADWAAAIQVWEDATLAQLHRVLQMVMGLGDYHLPRVPDRRPKNIGHA